MNLDFLTDVEIVEEIKNRFDVFIICGRMDNPSPEDMDGLLNTSIGDVNKKYGILELMQCGNNIFSSLGLLEIFDDQTRMIVRAKEQNTVNMMFEQEKEKDINN